jgi:cysteine synthase A
MYQNGMLNLIGHTPLVKLGDLAQGLGPRVFVKPEFLNPSGSIKDRIALKMIMEAHEQGLLRPGGTIVESSTGNTGLAVSFVGNMLGWKVIIYETTPGRMGVEKRKMMESFGAEVHSLPPVVPDCSKEHSVMGAEVEYPGRLLCLELERTHPGYWWARQFSNPGNTKAHFETGMEILEQCPGDVDVFVASIGTGGTLKGIAEVLKKENPKVRIVGIQPASSTKRIVPGGTWTRSETDGGIIADIVEIPGLVDEVVLVGDSAAVNMAHRLRREGFMAGVSSGANVLVALREAEKLEGGNVVTVLPDHMNRYFTDEHYVT